jgi:hypothetical protein
MKSYQFSQFFDLYNLDFGIIFEAGVLRIWCKMENYFRYLAKIDLKFRK